MLPLRHNSDAHCLAQTVACLLLQTCLRKYIILRVHDECDLLESEFNFYALDTINWERRVSVGVFRSSQYLQKIDIQTLEERKMVERGAMFFLLFLITHSSSYNDYGQNTHTHTLPFRVGACGLGLIKCGGFTVLKSHFSFLKTH